MSLKADITTLENVVEQIMRSASVRDDSFELKLKKLLKSYKIAIIKDGIISSLSITDKDYVCNTINLIEKNVGSFLNGHYERCFNSIKKTWFSNKGGVQLGEMFSKNYNLTPRTELYRIRRKEAGEIFTHKEMFHVPFEKRGVLDNYRYSLSGYPCLYCGFSVMTCWEEMHRPPLDSFMVSALYVRKNLKLLDLRLYQSDSIESYQDLYKYIVMLPLIMACSVKVKKDSDKFKPEYIMPQLLLSTICNTNDVANPQYDGIIYTSSRVDLNFGFGDRHLYDNVVIPVKESKESGMCDWLCDKFSITDPICYEYEIIRHGFFESNDTDPYSKSYFGILESRLKNETFYLPNN